MDELYSEILLDLYRHPLHKSRLANFDVHHKETNPLCGDEIEIFIKFGDNGKVTNVGWTGDGCAISQAAASLLTDTVQNKNKKHIEKITKEEILEMLGLTKLNPTRLRCALLGLECVKAALKNK